MSTFPVRSIRGYPPIVLWTQGEFADPCRIEANQARMCLVLLSPVDDRRVAPDGAARHSAPAVCRVAQSGVLRVAFPSFKARISL